MTKDGFWDLIAEAKKRYGQDQDGSFQWLKDQLLVVVLVVIDNPGADTVYFRDLLFQAVLTRCAIMPLQTI